MAEARPKIQVLGYYSLSGDLRPLTVNASGELDINVTVGDIVTAKISGETVIISGQPVSISGQPVDLVAENVAVSSGKIAVLSGEIHILSGEVISKISGEVVRAEQYGTWISKISGETVIISGQDINIIPATQVKTGPIRILNSDSGGIVLHSGSVKSLTVKALSTNSGDIYIGGVNDRPYSGYGFLLAAGEGKSYDIDNFSKIYLMAVISGDRVTFDGII